MATAVAAPVTVTLVSGESRVIERTWTDAYECPWCWYPVTGDACGNPACDTMLGASELAARRDDQRRRAEAEAAEASLKRQLAASRERAAEAEAQLWGELSARALAAGQCVTCLRRSYWRSSPRFVKHRDSGNCPHAVRQS